MQEDWVDFKSVKAKVSMETVLSHYDVRLRRVGVDQFRGRCPLPTHSSARSNNSFSVSFIRNVWSCQSASCIAARSGRVGGNVFDFVAEMERCSIRRPPCAWIVRSQKISSLSAHPCIRSRLLIPQKIGLYLSLCTTSTTNILTSCRVD